jgi:lysozyme family protein
MSRNNLENVLPVTLAYEGGFQKNPKDKGNWTGGKIGKGVLKGTNMGISAAAHPTLDIAHLTLDDVLPIYEKGYWDPMGCETLLSGVDLAVFDAGVMSGPSRARKWLMKSIGGDAVDTVKKVSRARSGFVQGLKSFVTFGKGWMRRVTEIEAKGIAMAMQAAYPATGKAVAKTALREEAVKADDAAKGHATAATTAGAGTAATAPSAAASAVQHGTMTSLDVLILSGLALGLVLFAAFFLYRFVVNRQRAQAFKEQANAVA